MRRAVLRATGLGLAAVLAIGAGPAVRAGEDAKPVAAASSTIAIP